MVPIGDIPEQPFFHRDIRERESPRETTGEAAQASEKPGKTTSAGEIKDRVELSANSRNNCKEPDDVRGELELLKSLPSLSQNRYEQIMTRIASGFYQKPEVVDKIADAMIQSPAVPAAAARNPEGIQSSSTFRNADSDWIQDIRQKIQGDVYSSDDVLNTIVDRMIAEEHH
jgi:hypothetical protein